MLEWEHKEAFGQTNSICPKCGAFALYKFCSTVQAESNFCPTCGVQLKQIVKTSDKENN